MKWWGRARTMGMRLSGAGSIVGTLNSNEMIYNPCVAETPILDLSLSDTSWSSTRQGDDQLVSASERSTTRKWRWSLRSKPLPEHSPRRYSTQMPKNQTSQTLWITPRAVELLEVLPLSSKALEGRYWTRSMTPNKILQSMPAPLSFPHHDDQLPKGLVDRQIAKKSQSFRNSLKC